MTELSEWQKKAAEANGWDLLWKESTTPWREEKSPPALVQLLAENVLPKGTKASPARYLVPGCGSGMDVLTFAEYGNHESVVAVGLDVSPTAVGVCNEHRDSKNVPSSVAQFVAGDFFKPETLPKPFDVVFDYTFLCALPPAMRSGWAARMRDLVVPHGHLICLMYPLASHEGGPPFALSIDTYQELLGPNFQNVFIRDCESIERRRGKEKLSLWQRKS